MVSYHRDGDKMVKPLKTHISITLDVDVYEKAKLLAEEDDRSLSSYINLLLRDRIRAWEEQEQRRQH